MRKQKGIIVHDYVIMEANKETLVYS